MNVETLVDLGENKANAGDQGDRRPVESAPTLHATGECRILLQGEGISR